MAATKLTCPECSKVLRPAKPLAVGAKVKCPKCSTVFVAQDDDPETPAPVTKSSGKAEASAKAEGKKKAAKKSSGEKPPKEKAAPKGGADDDDEGGPATYAFVDDHKISDEPEINYVPDTSIKDLRGPAQAAVIRPSNFLMLIGVLGFINYLAYFLFVLILVLFPPPEPESPAGPGAVAPAKSAEDIKKEKDTGSMFMIMEWDMTEIREWAWWQVLLLTGGCVAGMIYCGITVYGGVKMQTLESRQWGLVASVLVMPPMLATGTFGVLATVFTFVFQLLMEPKDMIWVLPLWIIAGYGPNLAIGIWSLMTLMKPEVIEGYEFVPE